MHIDQASRLSCTILGRLARNLSGFVQRSLVLSIDRICALPPCTQARDQFDTAGDAVLGLLALWLKWKIRPAILMERRRSGVQTQDGRCAGASAPGVLAYELG